MASVNHCIILGNLGQDPTMRYLPSGEAVATFSVATTEHGKISKAASKNAPTGTASSSSGVLRKSAANT